MSNYIINANTTILGDLTCDSCVMTSPLDPEHGGTGVNNGTNTLTITANSTINQNVSTTGNPTFATVGATTFNGNLNGNASTATTASTASTATTATTALTATTATTSTSSTRLTITENNSNAKQPILFTPIASSSQDIYIDNTFGYNPNTNTLDLTSGGTVQTGLIESDNIVNDNLITSPLANINSITSLDTNTNLTLTGNGTGVVYVNDNLLIGSTSANGLNATRSLNMRSTGTGSSSGLSVANSDATRYMTLWSGHNGDDNPSFWFNVSRRLRFATSDNIDGSGYNERAGIDSTGLKLYNSVSGYTAAGLNYYEETTYSSTTSGAVALTNYIITIRRIGDVVHLKWVDRTWTTSANARLIISNLPARFRPSGSVNTVAYCRNFGSDSLAAVYISSTGNIEIMANTVGASFSSGTNSFAVWGGGCSYII